MPGRAVAVWSCRLGRSSATAPRSSRPDAILSTADSAQPVVPVSDLARNVGWPDIVSGQVVHHSGARYLASARSLDAELAAFT